MPDMCSLVIAEHMRTDHALQLRIEMRKEIRVTQQHPVKENDVVDLHGVEHGEKPHKEVQEAEAVSDAVPYA